MVNSDLQTGFYFSLRLPDDPTSADAAFQEVSGLAKEVGVEEVVSGGENRFKYRLPTGVSYQNLVLKRGILLRTSSLVKWCVESMDGGHGKAIATKDVQIRLLNPNGKVAMGWHFTNAWPVKWAISDLRSQENAMLIETIELAYHYFELSGRDGA